ncbi:MAG: response regulator [Methylobacter sp.]|nr:response regulator [Methylobacter sp.]MDP2098734.1 response regulator [Methylobacter sp.]MDP2426513.1 response regulator [Methylobacter sp.]MDP3056220.1 response regulator [Methylobacter sp.]MDP3361484.1 response regulator [Methylobacter sp.]
MKRNEIIESSVQDKLKYCIAFHEAGYATAIYLNNKAKNFPSVFFQIMLEDLNSKPEEDRDSHAPHEYRIAKVEGGRLITTTPPFISGSLHKSTDDNDPEAHLIEDYMIAFEADTINQLIGPLAEAKHVADVDDEPFDQRLINLEALKNYGGDTDIALAVNYVQRFFTYRQQQDEKLHELFLAAFNFINDRANWAAITKLANYILKSNNNVISAEEVASLVDEAIMSTERSRIASDKAAILFVDDEVNVLNSLRRLFHSEHYVTYFASNGVEGLRILQQNAVDIVISDMCMPEMNGAEFLARVVMQWPETTRILLTGHTDMQSTIDAVNKGRIYHYCNKPWNNEELKLLVRNVLEQKSR